MANILQAVVTYNEAALPYLQNLNPWIYYGNKRFNNFQQQIPANRGATVSFNLPTRFIGTNGTLVATFQGANERVQTLTVDQAANIAYQFSASEFIFYVENDTAKFVKSATEELGALIGSQLSQNAINHTYRSFGDGVTLINTYQQYDQMLTNFRNYGAAKSDTMAFVSDVDLPPVIGDGLKQFALDRNNELANSWMIGRFSGCDFCTTNLLATHTAGTMGNTHAELTITAIDSTGTILTVTGAGTDANAFKAGDIITIDFPGASVTTGTFFLTFNGHVVSSQKVQARITANAASSAGTATITVFPALIDIATHPTNPNANTNISVVGSKAVVLPNHRAGLLYAGNPYFVAMPMLPEEVPYPTQSSLDEDSGASMRTYYGSIFGQDQHGYVNDAIWGSTLVDEYAMRIVYPETSVLTMAYPKAVTTVYVPKEMEDVKITKK
jgi:hypothetical protein